MGSYDWLDDPSLYKDKIKNNCFLCGIFIENSWPYYKVFGNCCTVCSARVVRVLYSGKQRRKSPITREQARFLLAVRKKWVFDNGKNRKIITYSRKVKIAPEPDEYALSKKNP